MKTKPMTLRLTQLVCCVLIAAAALMTTGCDATKTANPTPSPTPAPSQSVEGNVLGQGETAFTFTVVDDQGVESTYEIHTDQTTVGAALVELGLIAGEDSTYGLYVHTVNGLTVDYDTDGKYWAFYVDGAYAQTGVDATQITPGSTYTFKVE